VLKKLSKRLPISSIKTAINKRASNFSETKNLTLNGVRKHRSKSFSSKATVKSNTDIMRQRRSKSLEMQFKPTMEKYTNTLKKILFEKIKTGETVSARYTMPSLQLDFPIPRITNLRKCNSFPSFSGFDATPQLDTTLTRSISLTNLNTYGIAKSKIVENLTNDSSDIQFECEIYIENNSSTRRCRSLPPTASKFNVVIPTPTATSFNNLKRDTWTPEGDKLNSKVVSCIFVLFGSRGVAPTLSSFQTARWPYMTKAFYYQSY